MVKRGIIFSILVIIVFMIFFYLYIEGENIETDNKITVNMNLLPLAELEEIERNSERVNMSEDTLEKCDFVKVLDSTCKVKKEKKLFETINLQEFKPSYNMIVTQALSKIGETKERFDAVNENWSIDFISWCSAISDFTDIIPNVLSIEELKLFYESQNLFYNNAMSCYPLIGDLILLDDNNDDEADRVNIVSDYENGILYTVGGYIWCDSRNDYIVQEIMYSVEDRRIVGVCRPDYGLKKVENFSDLNFPFNAVDTVVYLKDESFAQSLAENGIKLIARYINPEGRYPLDIEEAQRYSNAGVHIMMIYQVNTDDPYKGYKKGIELGTKALEYARNLKATKGTPIFFCCDCNNRPESFNKVAEFLIGVREALNGEYGVGLYGGYYVNEAMYNLGLLDAYWQCWGFSDGYISDNFDIIQYTTGARYFEDIPYVFDANYVKKLEKVSYIMEKVD